ncbi:MAG: T9SS type A sorting domain-containing protein [Chitinophagaceae bacterium]|nr:T9SS type A sorting domain-containing protein [Chitinophagaceae bacterium]
MCIALFSSFSSSAQNYTKRYEQTAGYTFTLNDAVVMEKFRPSNLFPTTGTVIFQPVNNGAFHDLQVNLLDVNGSLQASRTYQIDASNSFASQDFIPIAAAYNEVTEEYCVAGIIHSTVTNNDYSTWVALFDKNLTLLDVKLMENITSTFSATNPNSTLVTDIAPVYDHPNGVDFVLTGLLTDGGNQVAPGKFSNASPALVDKRIFITEYETGGGVFPGSFEATFFDLSSNAIPKNYFPSRIIEIPNTNNTGGYLIAGNTKFETQSTQITDIELSMFYLRLDYSWNILDFQQRQRDISVSPKNFFVGDIKYDAVNDELRVAGSYRSLESLNQGFFADKLTSVTSSTGINLYSDTWNSTMQIGILELPFNPLVGLTKVGRMSSEIDEKHIITASVLENAHPSTNLTMKLPLLLNFRYQNSNLDNWTTAQDQNVFWYKRWAASSGPQHYYSDFNYTSQWYPNHCSFPLNESPAVQSSVHGSYCTIGTDDHVVVTQTDLYNQNDCSVNSSEGSLQLIPLEGFLYTSNLSFLSVAQSLVVIIDIGSNPVNEIQCDAGNQFKTIPNPLYTLAYQGEGILCQGLTRETNYELFSVSGAKVQSGYLSPSEVLNLNGLSRGLYILHLGGQTIKVIK